MKLITSIIVLLILSPICFLFGQDTGLSTELQSTVEKARYVRIMFYNCENYFDIYNDSVKNDDEFTPEGERHWNEKRYYGKQSHVAKLITAIGGWNPPELVGLCEVESRKVLNDLIYQSSLYLFEYKLIHKESPDPRGIDVALLYQPKKFRPIKTQFIGIKFPGEDQMRTRDILFVTGVTNYQDTLHVFVNHWPSRYSGQMETEEHRMFVATTVRNKVDSIISRNAHAAIVIMGDLNDYYDNRSLTQSLKIQTDFDKINSSDLYDFASYLQNKKGVGSHKYEGHWGILDHIIVSGSLLNNQATLHTTIDDVHIFNPPFLLEQDETYLGYKPFRTYAGFKYLGGFSDHLPVFIDLNHKEN
jgi:predicted extracellular nuclease